MKKLLLFSILLFFTGITLLGQEVQFPPAVISAGGSNSGTSPVVITRWRIGGINILTFPTPLKSATFEPIPDGLSADWSVKVYPNPVSDLLRVEFEVAQRSEYIIELLEMTGRKLFVKKTGMVFSGYSGEIDMTGYVSGIYLLRVWPDDQSGQRIFKINRN